MRGIENIEKISFILVNLTFTNKFGVPPETRTPTNGFGDRHAAITSGIRLLKLVPPAGVEPTLANYLLHTGYKSAVLPLNYRGIKIWSGIGESNSSFRLERAAS